MPGRALVEVQRLHARRRSRRQVVGVEVEDARPRTVRRALLVRAARGALSRSVPGTGRMSSGALGRVENSRGSVASSRLPIRTYSCCSHSRDAGLNLGSVRMCSKNSCSVPVKPTCAFTFSISACRRLTSSRPIWWICFGRQVGRRVRPDQVAVKLRPALHVLQADAVARGGQIFVADEVALARQRRPHLGRNRLRVGGLQARLVGRWNRRRETWSAAGRKRCPRRCRRASRSSCSTTLAMTIFGWTMPAFSPCCMRAIVAVHHADEAVEPLQAVLIILNRLVRRRCLRPSSAGRRRSGSR